MKSWKVICTIMMMVAVLCGCERSAKDAREAFVGDYTLAATGDVDLYMGAVKVRTQPINYTGELSIVPADQETTVWVKALGDSTLAHVSGTSLFMEQTKVQTTISGAEMQLSLTHGKATLVDNQLSWTMDVTGTASYESLALSVNGQLDIVATKK